jgi:hypothetical protein
VGPLPPGADAASVEGGPRPDASADSAAAAADAAIPDDVAEDEAGADAAAAVDAPEDAATDAPEDAPIATPLDASDDAPIDAPEDAAVDTPADAPVDAALDAPEDASDPEAGADVPLILADAAGDVGPDAPMGPTAIPLGAELGLPFDAVPSDDGTAFYFTAVGDKGPGLFKVPSSGTGTVTELSTGSPWVAPFGVALDTQQALVFVAETAGVDAMGNTGALYGVPVGGGTPAPVSGSEGTSPRGLLVVRESGADVIYFTGFNPSTGEPGLLRVPAAGGTLTVVAKGAPFRDPSGVTRHAAGDFYVTDTVAQDDAGSLVVKVTGGTASVWLRVPAVGYPAGIAFTRDETHLVLSGFDAAAGRNTISRIDLATKTGGEVASGGPADTDSAGLHRARLADVFAFCDRTAGGGGVIYRLEVR